MATFFNHKPVYVPGVFCTVGDVISMYVDKDRNDSWKLVIRRQGGNDLTPYYSSWKEANDALQQIVVLRAESQLASQPEDPPPSLEGIDAEFLKGCRLNDDKLQ